jgi:ABC-2 type transport system permease protein
VIRTFLYLAACSFKNRVLRRFRRLREPRYLVGLVVGLVYLYFFVLRNQMRAGGRPGAGIAAFARFAPDIVAVGAIGLWGLAVVVWLWPFGSKTWTFTGAEVQFFFTAPVARRALLNYKLLRSQFGLLFGVAIAALFSGAARAAPSGRWSFIVGGWLLFVTIHLHVLGANLTKGSIRAPGSKVQGLAWASAAVIVLVSGAVVGTCVVQLPALVSRPIGDALRGIVAASRTGAAAIALWPFAAVIAPMFAAGPTAFLRALVPALAVVAANYWWVVTSDAQLEQAAAAAERGPTTGRRGLPAPVVRAAPFALVPFGRLETAILWKNTILFGRYASVAVLVRVLIPIVVLAAIIGLNQRGGSLAPLVLALACFITLLGPYSVRNDLRMDLPRLPVLKTWPISGRELLIGELLAPSLILSVVVWFLVAVAAVLAPTWRSGPGDTLGRAAVGLAVAVLAPILIAGQLVIQNAAVVLFPAWIVTGGARVRGVEAMGQRMVMLAATLLSLVIGVLPAAAVAGGLGWLLYLLVGWPAALPAAVVFAGILLGEAILVLTWLGGVLERTEPSQVEVAE